jgi:1-acyl-sn-glycerol-3-phosphate acyltransferase
MRAVRVVHSALCWLVVLPFTAMLGTAAAVVGLVSQWRALAVARLWARCCLAVAGCRLQAEGMDNFDPRKRYVIMVNHQSELDIPVLLAALPLNLRVVFWAKRSLFEKPFLGWAMSAMGFIPVDREQRNTAALMFASSLERVNQDRSLLVFPEETFSRDDSLLPFQRGGFLMALRTGLPILPVGIAGTRQALPPRTRVIRPGLIHVRFGSPIETQGLGVSSREQLTGRTRHAIADLCGAPQ